MINSKKFLRTRKLAWQIIAESMKKNHRLTDVLSEKLNQTNLNDREKRFAVELIQGTVRMKGRLDFELKKIYKGDWDDILFKVKVLLWMGAYQLKFMNSVPVYAAVSTSVSLAQMVHFNSAGLINAVLRVYSKNLTNEFNDNDDIEKWSEWLSHPSWLIRKWLLNWSKLEIDSLCNWNNKKPIIWFRLNTLIMNVEQRNSWLKKNEYKFKCWNYDERFFSVDLTSKLINSNLFEQGNFSIQDPAAGLVVKLLDPQKNEIIVDACAAPGGKSSFIAQIMENSGKIMAYDSDINRLNKYAKGMAKLKIDNVDAQMMDMSISRIPMTDKVLMDVPCTGTGVMSKRADLRWRRSIQSLYEMVKTQHDILFNLSKYVNKGGIIVYSTCSLEEEENWQVINKFLQSNKEWEVEPADKFIPKEFIDKKGALFTFPPNNGIDGGFAVRLIKR